MVSKEKLNQIFQDAIAYHQQGQFDKAEAGYRQVLKIDPKQADSLHLLGVIAHQRLDHTQAVELINRALSQKTTDATIYNNLGKSYRALEEYEKAVDCYKKAIQLNPDYQAAWNNLGAAYYGCEKTEESIRACNEAIRLKPKDFQAHLNLGNALKQAGDCKAAVESFDKALEINPTYYQAHFNLGNLYKGAGQLNEAVSCYLEVLKIKPDLAEAHNSLGSVYENQDKLKAARISLEKALQLKPDYIEALNNMGRVYRRIGQTTQAIKYYKKGLNLEPNRISLLNNLAGVLKEEGRITEALQNFRKIIEIDHNYTEAQSNLLFVMHYSPDLSEESLFEKHRIWGETQLESNLEFRSFNRDKNPDKRLKVGYVSPDFRCHSVAFFLEPILLHHNQAKFEIYCYSNVINPDKTTERLKELVPHWTSIVGMSNDEVTARILEDGIDILIDLAGHTGNNRLPVFARKPAPLQVSYLGYPNTTGLPAIDYRLTDAYADPPGATEKW